MDLFVDNVFGNTVSVPNIFSQGNLPFTFKQKENVIREYCK